MNLLFDECLSPYTAIELCELGHNVIHPRNQGGLGDDDHVVVARAIREDLTIVTANAKDYWGLVAKEPIHPGLIILPSISRDRSKELLLAAIERLVAEGEPNDVMVNQVLEVEEGDSGHSIMDLYTLSA